MLRGEGKQHNEADLLLQYIRHFNTQIPQYTTQRLPHGTVGQAQLSGFTARQRQVVQRLPMRFRVVLHRQPQQWQIGACHPLQQLQL